MEIITASTGSYPRVGDGPGQQKHREAYAKWEKCEFSKEEFERVQQGVTREIIEDQVRSGLDVVTDGQVRWYDPISHFARKLDGCEINGLLRFFDTNFYFRQPIIVNKVRWREPIIKEEFLFARGASPAVKPVLTGPYTLAKHSIVKRAIKFASLVQEFTDVIAKEVNELANAGAKIIQIDEPAILKNPKDFEILKTSMKKIVKDVGGAKIALYTYFGDAAPLYRKLVGLPVDVIGLDFTYSKKLLKLIADSNCKKELALGLIDGRNTRLESEQGVIKVLESILPRIKSERIYLNPSCGLGEYLPRDVAFRKLQNMVAIAEKARRLVQ